MSDIYHNVKHTENSQKNSWGSLLQTGSPITEKEQLLCNTHKIINCHDTFMPFHQPGTGRQ